MARHVQRSHHRMHRLDVHGDPRAFSANGVGEHLPDLGGMREDSAGNRNGNIAACRPDFSSGNILAEGWSDPALQKAGSSAGRILAVNQTRP